MAQLSAAVDAAARDTARRVEGVDGRVVEVKLASVLAMEERDQVAHQLAALERQLAAAGGESGTGGAKRRERRRRWSTPGGLSVRLDGVGGGGRGGRGGRGWRRRSVARELGGIGRASAGECCLGGWSWVEVGGSLVMVG